MPRLTNRVFTDLAIWMIGFGLVIGLAFPPFSMMVGLPAERVMTPAFYASTLVAGLVVGAANFALSRLVVGRRLQLLAERMGAVEGQLADAVFRPDGPDCDPEHCAIPVDSDDEVGASASAFNRLITTVARSRRVELARRDFSAILSGELEVDSLAGRALHGMLRHAHADGGAIFLPCDAGLRATSSHPPVAPDDLASNEYLQRGLRTGLVERIHVDRPNVAEELGFGPDTVEIVVAPAVFQGSVLGLIVLVTATGFDPDSILLVEQFRADLGLALNNAIAHDRLERLAAVDPLTEACNRSPGLDRLREEFARALRAESALGILMLDLDHFKAVNDTYGHVIGDRVLQAVARACRHVLRECDVLVRYGGEEFLVILPGASADDLVRIGQRMRQAAAAATVKADGHLVAVTVSVGGATYREATNSPEALIVLADDALYEAKRSGRDRLVAA